MTRPPEGTGVPPDDSDRTARHEPLPRTVRPGRDSSFDDVAVAPRYLAGGAGCGDDAFVPLSHHYWHSMHDEMGNHYVTTYDSSLRVAFVPEVSELMPDATALWQIRSRHGLDGQSVWSAAFTDETPPEIIGSVTQVLDDAVSSGPQGHRPSTVLDEHPDAVWDQLRAAGWTIEVDGWAVHTASPDGLASLAYRPPSRVGGGGVEPAEAWRAVVRTTPKAQGSLWEADFHSATPTRVLVAFAAAQTDPAPLTRAHETVPAPCRAYARSLAVAAADSTPAVPTPRDVLRVRAARAGRTTTASSRLAYTTTSPSTSARAAASRRR